MDQLIVLEGLDHEQGKVDAPRAIALQDRVADVLAPHWKALTFTFFEIAAAHNGPSRVALEDSPASFHLIVEIGKCANRARKPKTSTITLKRGE